MNKAVEFLKKCQTFYLATVEGDQPRVRPFGAVMEYKDKVYLCTNNKKPCFKQITENPKVEISGTIGTEWIRVCGTVVVDESVEAKKQFLEECPFLNYTVDDGVFEVIYFDKAVATISSFTTEPQSFEL